MSKHLEELLDTIRKAQPGLEELAHRLDASYQDDEGWDAEEHNAAVLDLLCGTVTPLIELTDSLLGHRKDIITLLEERADD